MRHVVLAVFAVLIGAAGCTVRGKPEAMEPPLLSEETASAAPSEPRIAAAPKPAEEGPKRRFGVIPRTELTRVLDGAPGRFLQHVSSEPRFRSGRFAGWKLVAFFPGDDRFSTVDLRAGDVVLRVNGSSIERPEHLIKIWDALRSSRELVVDVEREGIAHTLRYTIAD
jgi:hypothetical protein